MNYKIILVLCVLFSFSTFLARAQDESAKELSDSALFRVETYGGGEFIGKKLLDNEKVVVIQTSERGKIEIPKYEIKEIRQLKANELTAKGAYVPDQVFATRYFISTNGLPITKGESYVLFNIWGPDVSFGVVDNLSLGVMSTWIASPIIATMKYSIPVSGKHSFALGLLAGLEVWTGEGGGVLPFASYTYGTRKSNITVSGGYARIYISDETGGSTILSLAGMRYITRKVSFVFDSWIMPDINDEMFALLMPGLRFQWNDKSAFQFGFTGALYDGAAYPVPVPMLHWFRKF